MVRSKSTQSKHDKAVRKVAGGYKSQGWKVKADISGYPQPKTVYGKRPDVLATKGAKTRVVEVETKNTYHKDTSQRNAFKRFASLDKKRRFKTKVV